MGDYADREIMAISAGRLIKNDEIIFAGTGLSMLAATVAKRIHAPKAVVFFQTGGIDPSLELAGLGRQAHGGKQDAQRQKKHAQILDVLHGILPIA